MNGTLYVEIPIFESQNGLGSVLEGFHDLCIALLRLFRAACSVITTGAVVGHALPAG